MTVSELKKILKEYNQDEIIKLVLEIRASCKDAKKYLDIKYDDGKEELKIYNEAHDKIEKVFHGNPMRMKISAAKKPLSEFKKFSKNPELVMDLELYYVECGVWFTNEYGDMYDSYYDSFISVFDKFVNNINSYDNYDFFLKLKERIIKLVADTQNIGYGFPDDMEEYVSNIKFFNYES